MPSFASESLHPVTLEPGDQWGAVASAFTDGRHVVVWNSGSTGDPASWQVFAQVYGAQGQALGGPMQLFSQLNAMGDVDVVAGGVAALPDGSFVISGRSERLDPNHSSPPTWYFWEERVIASGAVLVAPAAFDSLSSYDYPSAQPGEVAVGPGGSSFFIETNSAARPVPIVTQRLAVQGFDLAGHVLGPQSTESFLSWGGDSAVLAGGHVLLARADGYYEVGLYVDAFDAAGNHLGGSTVPGSYFGNTGSEFPEVAALGDGNGLVVWTYHENNGPSQTVSQVVDPQGQLVGARHVLGVDPVHLSSLASGGVLAWWDSGSGFLAQYIDQAGIAVGAQFAIGSGVSSVAAAPDGGFYVESVQSGTGTGMDVYEQKFDLVPVSGQLDMYGGVLWSATGDYAVIGHGALDQFALHGAHTQYSVTPSLVSGPEGMDTLTGVERLRFTDNYGIALDIGGHAGEAYRLYKAAFDRVPDLPGLGYQINDLDKGWSLEWVANNFVASPEFQSTYGASVSNEQFVTLLYRNVLDREPESAGLQYHLDEFAAGATRAQMLLHFSESPENQANVIGQIADGILYVPFA